MGACLCVGPKISQLKIMPFPARPHPSADAAVSDCRGRVRLPWTCPTTVGFAHLIDCHR